jgi:pyruvate dehydrogenase E2 component (dihydrolipoamide acetyltransferase)
MSIEVLLPQFGMGMTDGTIISWLKAEGDAVAQGEILCEIEAAKTTVELEAPCDGVLAQILVGADVNVPVQTPIAVIATAGAEAPVRERTAEPAAASALSAAAEPAARPQAAPGSDRIIEPRARRLAGQLGVDLDQVSGTGPGGRVTEEDVQQFAAGRG